jgi:glycine/D-amino acid oxidase-like deaminating enzyme
VASRHDRVADARSIPAYRTETVEGVKTGGVSHWHQQLGLPTSAEPLPGDRTADVCIVGGGLTGLWTAYYLSEADPTLDIVVLESEFVGYGASGRNGGWLSAELPGNRATYARGPGGMAAVDRLAAELADTVDRVIDVCQTHGIDADVTKSGILYVATSAAQLARLQSTPPPPGSRYQVLNAEQSSARINVAGTRGALLDPQAARVQPAKLVQGLADVVRSRGVRIYEQTEVLRVEPGRAICEADTVTARFVLQCLEGYTAGLPGHRRTWLPMNSAMVVTEPLSPDVWDELGWGGNELLGDTANAYYYAQRTADGRVALGGRGRPYRYGSATDVDGITQAWTIRSLRETLQRAFPQLDRVALDQAWCGVLAVPRDWCASVSLDPRTGVGFAGGYVGSGLTATNLAGRTLRDLVLGEPTDLTGLAWTNRPVRRWEPEPLRWLGVNAIYALYRAADRREMAGLDHPSRLAGIGDRISGR